MVPVVLKCLKIFCLVSGQWLLGRSMWFCERCALCSSKWLSSRELDSEEKKIVDDIFYKFS